jgi:hypothetical protein
METKERKLRCGLGVGLAAAGVIAAGRMPFFIMAKRKKARERAERLRSKLSEVETKIEEREKEINRLIRVGSAKDAEKLWKLCRSRSYYQKKWRRLERQLRETEREIKF